MKVIDGYDRRKNPREIEVRPMTLDEVKALTWGHVKVIDNHGKLRDAKINGKVRRWKRQPDKFELPLKYGMYEYVTFDNDSINRLVVEV